MTTSSVRRHPWLVGWLTAVWVGLWGSVTAANVLGGLAVAVLLLVLLPLPEVPPQGRVRPVALLAFVGFFSVELVRASLVVVWQVLRPRGELSQAVLALDVPGASDRLLALVANSISLTPGTLTLEVDRERSRLYVHALDVGGPDGVEKARRDMLRLVRKAAAAVGPQDVLDRLEVR
ncbi:MAG TPA: Na+/H+ antiporter subunit E [Mycobacteriales bacterium]|nr:Na+/H+ antiporter subunit E [Mycobacteriales bacterium]